ncbi:hypothetical protein HK102_013133, partial [Quaeritorhiza haematococci]
MSITSMRRRMKITIIVSTTRTRTVTRNQIIKRLAKRIQTLFGCLMSRHFAVVTITVTITQQPPPKTTTIKRIINTTIPTRSPTRIQTLTTLTPTRTHTPIPQQQQQAPTTSTSSPAQHTASSTPSPSHSPSSPPQQPVSPQPSPSSSTKSPTKSAKSQYTCGIIITPQTNLNKKLEVLDGQPS